MGQGPGIAIKSDSRRQAFRGIHSVLAQHSSILMITLSKFGLRDLQNLQLDIACDKAIVCDGCAKLLHVLLYLLAGRNV